MDIALYVLGGLVLLALGGELVVRGGVGAAKALNMSPLVIGVVLLGFGTSLPELVTSVQAALAGSPELALGNVVGSNISNILLIAGFAAALTGCSVSGAMLWRDGLAMLLSACALAYLVLYGTLDRTTGAALLGALAIYLVISLVTERRRVGAGGATVDAPSASSGIGMALLYLAIGVAATVGGARLLVDGGVQLARLIGASEALIGVTIIAIGTSLPELAASIAAAARGKTEMAIGNVLGSNVFNVCAIVGATALVAPITDPPAEALRLDIYAMLAACVVMLLLAGSWSRLTRSEGLLMMLFYGLYLALTISVGLGVAA